MTTMAQDEMLAQIVRKIDTMQVTVTAIDAAIKGDPQRGVIGITQHIQAIHEGHKEHKEEDDTRFEMLNKANASVKQEVAAVKTEINGFKRYVAGAVAVIAIVSGTIVTVIELIIKATK